jgi:OmpA-OmpF porin, OOP family
MNKRNLLWVLALAVVAGCTSASGPMHNTNIVAMSNGTQAYRVQCQGLLESSQSCAARAQKVCGDGAVTVVASIDAPASGFQPRNDPRELTFMCATPGPNPAP